MLAFSPTVRTVPFKVTSHALIGPRPWAHERLTQPDQPIRRRQRASSDGFEIGRTSGEAKLRMESCFRTKSPGGLIESHVGCYLKLATCHRLIVESLF